MASDQREAVSPVTAPAIAHLEILPGRSRPSSWIEALIGARRSTSQILAVMSELNLGDYPRLASKWIGIYHILNRLGHSVDALRDLKVQSTVPRNESRSSPRSNVFLTATLAAEGASRPVRIRNLSINGALLEGHDFPEEGKKAQLRRGSLSVQGEIAWHHGKYCGLRFDHTILVQEWVKRAGPEAQLRIDAAIEQLRSGAKSHWPEPALDRANSVKNIADELLQICERIALLPNMSVELAEDLLRIEALARSLERASRT